MGWPAYNRRVTRLPAALLLMTLLLGAGADARQPAPDDRPLVLVASIDGIIHPVAVEYVAGVIDDADASGADLVVIFLETPGGLLDSTRTIVSRMITSRAPVAVFVAPSGARAASAGFIITLAADVGAMAPGTHIGAAHPVSGSGEQMNETMSEKVASDTAAYARSLAEARGRNTTLAAEAVTASRAFTDREARQATPPLVDVVAADLDDLLRQLDGRAIRRFDGRAATLETTDAEIRRVEMTRRQRFLSAIAHPQIAYLLLTLGILGLTVELWNPGAIAPGVVGGVALLLAFFAMQILPVNTTGLLLIAFGIALLVLELKIPSFGVLGIGGTASLVLGSVMMTRAVPGVSVGLGVIVPTAIGLAVILLFLGRLALTSQRRPSATGAEALVGEQGRARTAVSPDAAGQVDVRGEIWRAVSREPLLPGQPVRVLGANGLTLVVEPDLLPPEGGSHNAAA
jgi:membrane-bound serine protease (ClpP class)